jgi:hypothetical protein
MFLAAVRMPADSGTEGDKFNAIINTIVIIVIAGSVR